tara:strand:- start:1920 stop:2108 length:189 start_codon:yes stop_codon:yes gene_type:complete
MADREPLMSVHVVSLIIMSRATLYIVVRSVCCSKLKGVDLDKEDVPEKDGPGIEEGVRDDGT